MHNELSQRPMEIDKTANGSTVMGGGLLAQNKGREEAEAVEGPYREVEILERRTWGVTSYWAQYKYSSCFNCFWLVKY